MIISASYKTDIPAFYGEWFMNRLRIGHCDMVNPYNREVYRLSLDRADVDGFLFWTKNIGPFLPHLPEIQQRGYPFVVQYTINGYPRSLEFSVLQAERAVDHAKRLAETLGPRAVVWRYDPVIFTTQTDADFHLRNFAMLARSLEGTTDEVVTSFAQIYKKTRRNLDWAAGAFGFEWTDPTDDLKRSLVSQFASMASAHAMELTLCAQDQYLVPGVRPARCIDAERLAEVAGRPIAAKLQGNRPDCGCYQSRDIGTYDTCPHGCVYCYAVANRDLAQERYRQHDSTGDSLG